MKKDQTCLAEGMVLPADSQQTGLNLNELIVGGTGCGKSMSVAYPRIVHTYDSSLVIPISKRTIMDQFAPLLKERGYRIMVLDFVHPECSTIGYDPLRHAHTEEEVGTLSKNIVEGREPGKVGSYDPYWDRTSESILSALMLLLKNNQWHGGKEAGFTDFLQLYHNMDVDMSRSTISTKLDGLFERLEELEPGNQASFLWKSFTGLPVKTASTLCSTANTTIDKFCTGAIREMMCRDEQVDFARMGEERTALFVISSGMNTSLKSFINLMYADLFRELFNRAEELGGTLPVPVHIICDDFACGSRILEFENYISIFRAAGISVTLLLQSESQLCSMYGEHAAQTIINNCDTYVYMGGMDTKTCSSVSTKCNKTFATIWELHPGDVIVFRRGEKPYFARRYQITEDEEYRHAMELYERGEEK